MAELELAGVMTAVAGAQRLVEVTLRYAGNAGHALGEVCGTGTARETPGREPAAAELMTAYRDYLRDLAALPGWLSMNFLMQLDQARSRRGGTAAPHSPRADRPIA